MFCEIMNIMNDRKITLAQAADLIISGLEVQLRCHNDCYIIGYGMLRE